MKTKKLFVVLPSLFMIASCGNVQPTNQGGSGSGKEEISVTFKGIGEDIAYIAASKEKPASRSLQDMSVNDKKIELQMPSILTYLVGKLYEYESFDCKDKVSAFRGVYDLQMGSNTTTMDITLSLMINLDETNNKVKFNGLQDSIQGEGASQMTVKSHIYLEIDYNFETKELGDFKMWAKGQNTYPGQSTPVTTFSYSQYIGGVAKKMDMNNKDEEYLAREAEVDAVIADFNSKAETKTVADTATARQYANGFIAAQNFTNEILGQELPISIHED